MNRLKQTSGTISDNYGHLSAIHDMHTTSMNIACEISLQSHKNFVAIITKTYPYKYTESFSAVTISMEKKMIFVIYVFAQNIDCGYTLEPPRRGE